MNKKHEVIYLKRAQTDDWRLKDITTLSNASPLIGDLEDTKILEKSFNDFRPDTIIHLAWEGVDGNARDQTSQANNLTRTINLLNLASKYNVKNFIGLGSQAEYGPCENIINEAQPTWPKNLYGSVKLATCLTAKEICKSENIRFAWLRLFSAYGPKDSPDYLISYLALSFLKGKKPSLTKCEQLWDYIYASDVATAVENTAQSKEANGIFNLGSGKVLPLKDIVESIRNLIDPNLPLGIGEIDYKKDQIMHLQADVQKLQSATGWQPSVSLEDGIKATIKWYKENINRY